MNVSAIISEISRQLSLTAKQVETVVNLLDEGATIPFLARYRQEKTGGLDEEKLREVRDLLEFLRLFQERKATILESIESQGKLTPELKKEIESCKTLKELEDLYLPYKPKRRTRADIAKEKGLEELAVMIWEEDVFKGTPEEHACSFIDEEKGVHSAEEALAGARDICAEWINEEPDVRKNIRKQLQRFGQLISKKSKETDEKEVYREYYEYTANINYLRPHQILAINRGEREGILKVDIEIDKQKAISNLEHYLILNPSSVFTEEFKKAISDSYIRLIFPALEREARKDLTEKAEEHAIITFAENLKNLLMQPPLKSQVVMGIDPGYRTGCKVAVIDETGRYLDGATIYPTPPREDIEGSIKVMDRLIAKYQISLVAIGNGTGSRETEKVVAELIRIRKERNHTDDIHYLIVNEAGASVYSASPLAKKEFPDLEAAMRGNISIARRVQDPLAELVKIDPKSIGVGLYQHDVNQSQLSRKLDDVVESCVNLVGVNVNTASAALLAYVSGLSSLIAEKIVAYRNENGPFKDRNDLKKVPGIGNLRFEQAAGFLRIPGSENPFDNTAIHPESYVAAQEVCRLLDCSPDQLQKNAQLLTEKMHQLDMETTAMQAGIGKPTLELILENLLKPGRDPRESLRKPLLRQEVLSIEDLVEGQSLEGTVRNVVDFGAFVDIGVKQDGLLHISQMSDTQKVKNPHDIVSVGDIIQVTVLSVDKERNRIGLGLKKQK
ncbi:Tex family protein [Balneolaceae bacterium ANBcel3]|nr:Tex family protein [Balneolaceae bacterium ANBcel3]